MRRSRMHVAIVMVAASSFGLALAPALAGESITYTYDALGRLVVAKSTGTVNNNETHSLCFDPAGNRTKYRSDDAGALPSCAPTPSPMPTPVAPATPGANAPPTAVTNTGRVRRNETETFNLVANDTDADGDLPLVLTAASMASGSCTVALASATEVSVTRSGSNVLCVINYTVTDTRGASSAGVLNANS